MPLIIIAFLVWLFIPKRTRTTSTRQRIAYSQPRSLPTQTTPAPVVYDPVKVQRERERQEDRARKLAEQKRKEAERIAKQNEARQAAADEVERLQSFIDRYAELTASIEQELNNNPGLTEYKRIQLRKQLLQTEEKIFKLEQRRNKAYFTAHN